MRAGSKRWPAFRPGRVFCNPRKGADELRRAVTLVTHAAIKLTSRQAAINQLNLKGPSSRHPRRQVATGSGRLPRRLPHMKPRIAKFAIGQVVKHRKYPFRGIIYDVDPVFAEYRGMVAVDSRGGAAAQEPAFLSSLRRKRRHRIYRLCIGAKPLGRHVRRSRSPSASRRDVRAGA